MSGAFDNSFNLDFDIDSEIDGPGAGFGSGFDSGFEKLRGNVATFSPTKRVWLERTSSATVQHSHPSGRVGKWTRPDSDTEGEGHETLLVFDFSLLPSYAHIIGVDLEIECNSQGSQTIEAGVASVVEQNKRDPSEWTVPDPNYGNFSTVAWSNILSSNTFKNTGKYNFPLTEAFLQLMNDWKDGVEDYTWGLVIQANYQNANHWLSVDNAVLSIAYSANNYLIKYLMRKRKR